MKAILVSETGGPEMLCLEEIRPPVPERGELLVDIEATGVNFIETYQRVGLYTVPLPYIPGTEAAGVVRAVGAEVTEFAPGDRVFSTNFKGAYAEQAIVAAARAVRVPDGVSTKQAAAVALQGMTAHYLAFSTFPLQSGHRVLVHAAAGGVGLLLCQIAKKCGAFVIGTASTAEKRSLAKAAGADEVIDYTTQDFAVEVKRITQGNGVDVVYDSVGKTTFEKSLDCLTLRGMMVLFGQSSGPVAPMDPQILNRKGSLFLTRPLLAHHIVTREELLRRANDLLGWMGEGSLDARIGAEFRLEKAADAHRALEGRKTTGKVLLIP